MDCIQIVFTIIEIAISAVALFFAIRIPKEIAKEQNKIVLIENRTRVYLDFVDLFSSTISWPLALPKAVGANIKRVNTWDNNVKNTFIKAELLFSSSLKCDLVHLREMYSQIRRYDELIEIGLSNVNNDDEKNEILQLFMKEGLYDIDNDEKDRLQRLSKKYEFIYNELVDVNEYEHTVINLYALSTEQNLYAKQAVELQKAVLEKMQKETGFN